MLLRSKKQSPSFDENVLEQPTFASWCDAMTASYGVAVPLCVNCWSSQMQAADDECLMLDKEYSREVKCLDLLESTTPESVEQQIAEEEARVAALRAEVAALTERHATLTQRSSAVHTGLALQETIARRHACVLRELARMDLSFRDAVTATNPRALKAGEAALRRANLWTDLFLISWQGEDVMLSTTPVVEAVRLRNATATQAVFGSLIHQIVLLAKKAGCILQRTTLNGYGFGAQVLVVRDFATTNRSKLRQRLATLLLAFSELASWLSHFDGFFLPYKIENDSIQRMSFTDISSLETWPVALKFFVSDIMIAADFVIQL